MATEGDALDDASIVMAALALRRAICEWLLDEGELLEVAAADDTDNRLQLAAINAAIARRLPVVEQVTIGDLLMRFSGFRGNDWQTVVSIAKSSIPADGATLGDAAVRWLRAEPHLIPDVVAFFGLAS